MRSGPVHGGFNYNPPMKPQIAILFLAGVLVCTAAWGLDGEANRAEFRRAPPAAAHAEGLTLDAAVARAEKQYNARVVRAEEKQSGERRVYQIRLLSSDGRVFDVTVDADTGRTE